MKHTDTPWSVKRFGPHLFIIGVQGEQIATCPGENCKRDYSQMVANVELIVDAVNSYHELQESLAEARAALARAKAA